MGVHLLAKALALVLTWALFAAALPSNGGRFAGISLREATTPEAAPLVPPEFNCVGNSPGCDGNYCPFTITSIKSIVDTIDDDREFTDKDMIACHRCATQQERPADYKQGICIFAKNLHKKTVTGKVLKESVNGLIKSGCGKCGGIAINPGTSMADGHIKVNFMRDSCETGVCDQRHTGNALYAARGFNTQKKSVDHVSNVSTRQDDPSSAGTLLGINCKGSTSCKQMCDRSMHRTSIDDLKPLIESLNMAEEWGNGEQIACVYCSDLHKSGICVFPQHMPDRTINGAKIKDTFSKIIANGCRICGSAPLWPGNNVNAGELTINYVKHPCSKRGVCTKPNRSQVDLNSAEVSPR